MDIPRIGAGVLYRPTQAWAGRSTDATANETGRPDAVDAPKPDGKAVARTDAKPDAKPAGGSRATGSQLTDEQQKQVDKLKAVDTKVRQHEAAHQAAGGGLAGGASFTFQEGPDGKRYAVGGEVPIKIGGASSPEATVRQLQQVKSAALAPADPSGQDLAVAAQATASQAEAQNQANAARAEETAGQGTGQGQEGQGQQGAGKTGAGTGTSATPATAAPVATARSSDGRPEQSVGSRAADTVNAAVQDALIQATASTRALAARGIAAYGAAASVNAPPNYAAVHFA